MNRTEVAIFVVTTTSVFFVVVNALLFPYVQLRIQAMLTKTPVGFFDIIRMRLRGYPPQLLVRAMITLSLRGVKVSASEMESCYLAAVIRDEPVTTATELAELMEEVKRNESPHT
jgi:uncharacterized protein YqfA (UPF0365 family)